VIAVSSAAAPRPTPFEVLNQLNGGAHIPDPAVDAALGLRTVETENSLDFFSLLARYGPRFFGADLHWVQLTEVWRRISALYVRRVLDLGSGYGRLAFYGALMYGVEVTGIELIEERAQEAVRVRDALGLTDVTFICDDLTTGAWPSADCVCFMNSTTRAERDTVVARLANIASTKSIAVVSCSTANPVFAAQPWLRLVDPSPTTRFGIQVAKS
jgi:SAM-dependent methyltransferase